MFYSLLEFYSYFARLKACEISSKILKASKIQVVLHCEPCDMYLLYTTIFNA